MDFLQAFLHLAYCHLVEDADDRDRHHEVHFHQREDDRLGQRVLVFRES